MNVGLKFRELLSGAFQVVQEELDHVLSGIGGIFTVEHKQTGKHSDITADTVEFNTGGEVKGDFQVNAQTRLLRGPLLLDPTGNEVHIAGLRPASFSTNQNNYAPGGIANAVMVEMEPTADVDLTGVSASSFRRKRLLLIGNRGNTFLRLRHNSSSSTAANRFGLPANGDWLLGPQGYGLLYYDVGSQIWRLVNAWEPVSVRAYLTADQSVANDIWTKITLNGEDFDHPNGLFDPTTNYRFTAPIGGRYPVAAAVRFDTGAGNVAIRILKNGATVVAEHYTGVGLSSGHTAVVADVYQLAQGDYLELYAYQNSGGAANAIGGTQFTHMSVHYIGGS